MVDRWEGLGFSNENKERQPPPLFEKYLYLLYLILTVVFKRIEE